MSLNQNACTTSLKEKIAYVQASFKRFCRLYVKSCSEHECDRACLRAMGENTIHRVLARPFELITWR